MTPLTYGDLVIVDRTYHGILLSDADHGDNAVAVAIGNGTEEMVAPRLLVPVPLAPGSRSPTNFAEWTYPMAQPVDRAINAFTGTFTERDSAEHHLGFLSLFLEMARMLAYLPPAAFRDSTRHAYVAGVIAILSAAR